MTSPVFRKIFAVYAALFLLASLGAELYITSVVRDDHVATLRRHLESMIGLVSKNVSFSEGNLDAYCREVKESAQARVTIIQADGRVTGDSDRESAQMDNHAHRTEVQQAAEAGAGMAVRYSDTLRSDFLYVALRIDRGGSAAGFIRLAVPLTEVDRSVNALRIRIILVVLAVLLVTWGVSTWQTDHLRRLLGQIAGFSRSLARGDLEKRLFLQKAGEFSEIAENLASMSVTLRNTITQGEEERNRLNVILKSVPDALLIIDARGLVVLSSSSVRDFFGDLPAAGMHIAEVVRNHEFSDLLEEVRRNLAAGSTELSIEIPAERHFSVRVSPLSYHEEELSGFVAIFHDITEMRKLEQVRKDFVANVSHELKTPITAIKGFADTLLEGALADADNARRFVETIKSNSERINALVDDLMTISKIELGVIKVEKTMVDLDSLFANVRELFQAKAEAKGISLAVKLESKAMQISADRNRLIQILSNLVDNAVKFTESGGVTFGLEQPEGEGAHLFVEDTGIGVPAKFVTRLGERFFRVDPARSRKMGGTGLGLAIVKHLVRAHGWSMQIESIHGKGTRVKIIL